MMTEIIVQLIIAFACGYAFAKNSENPPHRGSLPFMRGGDIWNDNPPRGPTPRPPAAPPPPPSDRFFVEIK